VEAAADVSNPCVASLLAPKAQVGDGQIELKASELFGASF